MLLAHTASQESPVCYVEMLYRRSPGMSHVLNQFLNGLHGQINGCNFIGAPFQLIFYQLLVSNFMLIFNLMLQAGPEILCDGADLNFCK